MDETILSELRTIEQEEGVEVLYACESGSRAWGFASTDSDYDVRFIYLHRPEWYLSIRDRRDVIEKPLDGALDFAGCSSGLSLEESHSDSPRPGSPGAGLSHPFANVLFGIGRLAANGVAAELANMPWGLYPKGVHRSLTLP